MTMGGVVSPELERRGGLPPDEYWLIDPSKTVPTPTDHRGLIDVPELIEVVKSYVDPAYVWPFDKSVHHIYWDGAWYTDLTDYSEGEIPARGFRELPPNKLLLPKQFENVLHTVTAQPQIPSAQAMRKFIDGWRAARNLFGSTQELTHQLRLAERRGRREDLSDEERLNGQTISGTEIARQSRGVELHLGALMGVDPEYRPFQPEEPLHVAASTIGEICRRGYQRRTRAVRVRRDGTVAA